MRVGILGCGRTGRIHAAIYARHGHQIIAVANRGEAARHEVATQYGAAPYSNGLEMIEREPLELVSICTPPAVRVEPTLVAARKGVHIFCEKPMALTLQDAKAMWSAVEAGGVAFGTGFKLRFEGAFATTHHLLTEGAVGRPEIVLFSYFQPRPSIGWYLELGVLQNMLIHGIDLAGWFLGSSPALVQADLRNTFSGRGEDRAELNIGFAGGRALLTGGYFENFPVINGQDDICFQVVGSAGYIAGARRQGLFLVNKRGTRQIAVEQGDGFAAEIAAFLRALAIGTVAVPVTGLDGLKAQAVIEASLESARSGRAATVPIVE